MSVNIAVIGNPNSGKTTLFNGLTGGTQRVGNWPGVTVESKTGYYIYDNNKFEVVDLPGIYSLSATSEDERIALEYILSGKMDTIINIIDGTNLERNLYLTFQLIEMRIPMIVVVNMLDIVKKRGITLDLKKLETFLDCPVFGITATKKLDTTGLKIFIATTVTKKYISNAAIPYSEEISKWLTEHAQNYAQVAEMFHVNPNWVALQLLEKNHFVLHNILVNTEHTHKNITDAISSLNITDDSEIIIAEKRYDYIHDIAAKTLDKSKSGITLSDKIDKVMLNRVFGIPIFLLMMYLVFWATLTIGGSFIDFFDIAFGAIFVDGFATLLTSLSTPDWLITILSSGVGAGIQTVSTFVPIIFVMFVCLAILEDSGYMARAAFVMDRFMRAIGLPGKSFVPMLVGFGCTVPAVMATRTLESTRDRILTTFMVPFMSCGARLPVYALFGAAFFGSASGLIVFSIYLTGAVLAIFTGLLLKNTLLKGTPSYFIIELPPYHAPRVSSILYQAWNRTKAFIFRAGKVIIVAIMLLGFLNSLGIDGSFGNEDAKDSVLSVIGSSITPIFKPMGMEKDNWPAAVALFTGLFAKEAVVGTLNSLYAQNSATPESKSEGGEGFSLSTGLKEAFATIPANLSEVIGGLSDPLGIGIIGKDEYTTAEEVGADKSIFTNMRSYFTLGNIQIYAYLLFILLYVPCLAAMGAVTREIGGRLALILASYLTLLAWIVSTLVFQIGIAHQTIWIVIPLVMLVLITFSLKLLGKHDIVQRHIGHGHHQCKHHDCCHKGDK